jgi:hypothetical protein
LILDFIDSTLDVAALIFQLLIGDSELLKGLLLLIKLLLNFKDFLLKSLGLLLAAFTAGSRNLALHLLDLELSII